MKGSSQAQRKWPYQKLTQHQHILKRPDTYVGSIEEGDAGDVGDGPADRAGWRSASSIQYVPGLYKIFDEIVVNAADNKQRDDNMNEIKIEIDREKGRISVWNNGKGIPVVEHKEHKIYVPELIFGQRRARQSCSTPRRPRRARAGSQPARGSNFDDDQKKTTGGRNGYGAKLANIFSSEFIVETADADEGKVFKQVFQENMLKVGKPKITTKATEGWTKITWTPDWPKFGMDGMDDDIIAADAPCYDIAGCTRRQGRSRSTSTASAPAPQQLRANYVDLYLGPKLGGSPRVFEKAATGGRCHRGERRRLPAGLLRQLDRDDQGRHARVARRRPGRGEGARVHQEEAQGDGTA